MFTETCFADNEPQIQHFHFLRIWPVDHIAMKSLALTTNQKMLNYIEDSLSRGAPGSVNSNGGGGGSHHLEPFRDGPSQRLGVVYKMTPKAATREEYRDDCKVRSLPRRSDFLLPLTEILTVFMMYANCC